MKHVSRVIIREYINLDLEMILKRLVSYPVGFMDSYSIATEESRF